MINAKKLGLAGGILWAAFMFLVTILAVTTDCGRTFLDCAADLYLGYSISWEGAILALIWGFIEGFVFLFLLGWLYNKVK